MADGAVPVAAVRELMRRIHSGPSQEAATARIALAVWRRAVERADGTAAADAAREVVARFEVLFDGLAAIEAEGKRLIAESERPG